MIKIKFPCETIYNMETDEFEEIPEIECEFEYSLVAISKWEAVHHVSYLSGNKESLEPDDVIDIYRCMMFDESKWNEIKFRLDNGLGAEQFVEISKYMGDSQTATFFTKQNQGKHSRELVTSELVYYWMVIYGIPFIPCENWHINRLMTLIEVCSRKQAPSGTKSQRDQISEMMALNSARKGGM